MSKRGGAPLVDLPCPIGRAAELIGGPLDAADPAPGDAGRHPVRRVPRRTGHRRQHPVQPPGPGWSRTGCSPGSPTGTSGRDPARVPAHSGRGRHLPGAQRALGAWGAEHTRPGTGHRSHARDPRCVRRRPAGRRVLRALAGAPVGPGRGAVAAPRGTARSRSRSPSRSPDSSLPETAGRGRRVVHRPAAQACPKRTRSPQRRRHPDEPHDRRDRCPRQCRRRSPRW